MTANFTLSIINNTGGAVTFNGATNGVDSPATSYGNPPVINQYVPAGQTTTNAVQACGGQVTGMQIYPNTEGTVSYNLPDASVVSFTWNVPVSGNPSCSAGISAPTSYTVGLTNSGGNYTATLAPASF